MASRRHRGGSSRPRRGLKTRRGRRAVGKRSRSRGRGGSYETSSIKRRRTPTDGRGIGSLLKGLGRFAAKNAPTILKGVRYLANKSGNKTVKDLASSRLLDRGAAEVSKRFGGRGSSSKQNAARSQAKRAVRKLIKLYGVERTRNILRSYVKSRGRGVIGKVLDGLLSTILPF